MTKFMRIAFSGLLASSAGVAFAATTATLNLSGIVQPQFDIQITEEPGASTLDILGGENEKIVATVVETSNAANGHQIKMSSQNNGQLQNMSDPSVVVGYQIKYGTGGLVTPTSTPTQVAEETAAGTYNRTIYVTMPATPNASSGTYVDQLTFEIAAR